MNERIHILRDTIHQYHTERSNRTMMLVSLVATFFLPLTFVASLLGMNVQGIPGADSGWGFVMVCGVMVIILLLEWWLFKCWQWLK